MSSGPNARSKGALAIPVELTALQGADFVSRYTVVSSPAALRAALRACAEVQSLKRAMREGRVLPVAVDAFVSVLLEGFERGKVFGFDVALAALAAGVEALWLPWADRFLTELSNLRVAEIPLAGRVAALSLRARKRVEVAAVKYQRVYSARDSVLRSDEEMDFSYRWRQAQPRPGVSWIESESEGETHYHAVA